MNAGDRLIGKEELLRLVPFTIQHIYRLEKQGKFVKRVRIGENRVAWVYSEVIAWIEERINEREQAQAGGGPAS